MPMAMLAIVLTATATHAQTAAFDSGNERQQVNKYIDANSKLNAKQLQLKEHLGNVVSEELLKQASSPREATTSDYATDGSASTPHLQISLLTCGQSFPAVNLMRFVLLSMKHCCWNLF